jgi:hypothetical protein
MSSDLTVLWPWSAAAVPVSAAKSATIATTIAGDGRRLKIPNIVPPPVAWADLSRWSAKIQWAWAEC